LGAPPPPTALLNRIRGLLTELGLVVEVGAARPAGGEPD
jgi:hypothetical protein